MSKKYDVVAITGKYTDGNGQEKNRYTNIGVVLDTSKGLSIKLEAVPVNWDGWAGLYEPKAKEGGDNRQRPKSSTGKTVDNFNDLDDGSDVPF